MFRGPTHPPVVRFSLILNGIPSRNSASKYINETAYKRERERERKEERYK